MQETHLPPFQLDRELWTKLTELGEMHSAKEGTTLFRQGDSPRGAYLLVRGSVALTPDDKSARLRRTCRPGCLLGLPATVRNKPYSLTAECLEECEYVRISHELLVALLQSNAEFCMRVVEVLANEIGELRSRIPGEATRFTRLTDHLARMDDWSA